MNRFGLKTSEKQQTMFAPSAQHVSQGVSQQPGLYNQSMICEQPFVINQMQYNPKPRFPYSNAEDSDEETIDDQDLMLITQQNLLLSTLIRELERNITQMTTTTMQTQEIKRTPAPLPKLKAGGLRRAANGIRKMVAAAGPSEFSSRRKEFMAKKLSISRKIAQKLLEKNTHKKL